MTRRFFAGVAMLACVVALVWACASADVRAEGGATIAKDRSTSIEFRLRFGLGSAAVDTPPGTTVDVGFTGPDGNPVGEVTRLTIPGAVEIPAGATGGQIHIQPVPNRPPPPGNGLLASGGTPSGSPARTLSMDLGDRPLDTRITRVGYPIGHSGTIYAVTLDLSFASTSSGFWQVWSAIRPVVLPGPGAHVPDWLEVHQLVEIRTDVRQLTGTVRVGERHPFTHFQFGWNKNPAYATLAYNCTVQSDGQGWHIVEVVVPVQDVLLDRINDAFIGWQTEGQARPDVLDGWVIAPAPDPR